MVGKKTIYCGLAIVAPQNGVLVSSSSRGRNESFENQVSSKTLYKDYGFGCSSKFTKTKKAGGFVDRRNGNQGYKEEVKYKSSTKVNDKIQGSTTVYETQVKQKKITTYTNPNKSSGGVKFKRVGTSTTPSKSSGRGVKSCKTASTSTKPSKSSGGVKSKTVSTCTKPRKSSGGGKEVNIFIF